MFCNKMIFLDMKMSQDGRNILSNIVISMNGIYFRTDLFDSNWQPNLLTLIEVYFDEQRFIHAIELSIFAVDL